VEQALSGIDPICLHHGKRQSEHEGGRCLYCCMCFRVLTPDECHVTADGMREDVCEACAEMEARGRP